MPAGGGWDETGSSYRYRVRDPEDFQDGMFRTIAFGDSGIKAVVGKLPGEDTMTMQTLIFPKDKFTLEEARKWVKEHPETIKKDEWAREGRIIKADTKKRYTLGVVYEPNVEDSQGEWSDEEEIEKACWNFMRGLQGKSKVTKSVLELLDLIVKGLGEKSTAAIDITDIWEDVQKAARGLGYMHEEWGDDIGDIVECYTAPVDMTINGEHIQKGTWLMGVVWSPEYFKKVEKGEITGFSMGGRGRRIYKEVEKKVKPKEWRQAYEGDNIPHWAEDLDPSTLAQRFLTAIKEYKVGNRVLEIGCGNGRDSIFFARAGLNVTAIDIAEGAVELAKKNAKDAGIEIEFRVANAEKLPFPDKSFDAVFTLSVLHATNLSKSISETARVLKKGGLLNVHIYSNTYYANGNSEEHVNVNEFIKLLMKSGYELIDIYTENEDGFDESSERHKILVALAIKN